MFSVRSVRAEKTRRPFDRSLDWEAVANITGDLATVKKTVQTLNNRLNGMHSSKITDEDLIRQFAQQQQTKPNGRMIGG